jgi:hypothetical protein
MTNSPAEPAARTECDACIDHLLQTTCEAPRAASCLD